MVIHHYCGKWALALVRPERMDENKSGILEINSRDSHFHRREKAAMRFYGRFLWMWNCFHFKKTQA